MQLVKGDDGCVLRGDENPDRAARTRPIVGLEILHGLKELDDGRPWGGGTIYDPTGGRTYSCAARLESNDFFYEGISALLDSTTTWLRVGTEKRQCRN
jgi:uncharacterized protein (DUF2147 family)